MGKYVSNQQAESFKMQYDLSKLNNQNYQTW